MKVNDLQILGIRRNGDGSNMPKCLSVNFWLLTSVLRLLNLGLCVNARIPREGTAG